MTTAEDGAERTTSLDTSHPDLVRFGPMFVGRSLDSSSGLCSAPWFGGRWEQTMFILQQMVGLVKELVGKKAPSPKGGQS